MAEDLDMLSVLELQVLRRSQADRYAQLYRNSKLSRSERLTRLREVKQLLGTAGMSSAPFNADAPSIAPLLCPMRSDTDELRVRSAA